MLQVVFEQIWAAEDFEIYKRLMVQRNIELELQALQLMQQQQAHKVPPSQPEVMASAPPQHDQQIVTDEDEILKEVLRRSKLEYEVLQKNNKGSEDKAIKDMEKDFAESHEDNIKM